MSKENDIKEAYKIAISARNFHFNNFSKWMTYYYLAVAAIFVAFYSTNSDTTDFKIGLPLLGFFVSILWHLSCKGYYFWIKNWTFQISRFEDDMEDEQKVYSVFSEHVKEKENKLFSPIQSANISTSKLTLILSLFVCFIWSYLSIYYLSTYFDIIDLHYLLIAIVAVCLTYVIIFIAGIFLKSDLSEHKILKP
jgi:hypothetical protein